MHCEWASRDRELAKRRSNLLQRVVDFTSGVAYTIDGKIQKLAESIISSFRPDLRQCCRLARLDDGRRNFRLLAEPRRRNEAWKITPVDIQHKSFKKALQGYDRADVAIFLDEIIESLEDEAQQRAALEAEISDLKERVSHFKAMEESLQNTLVLAQRTADEVKASAHKEADLIREQARLAGEREIAGYNDAISDVRREQQRAVEATRKAKQ